MEFGYELFGFNRKNVSDYIKSLSHSAKTYDEENEAKCKKAEAELVKLNTEIEEIKNKLEEAELALALKSEEAEKYKKAYDGIVSSVSEALEKSKKEIENG